MIKKHSAITLNHSKETSTRPSTLTIGHCQICKMLLRNSLSLINNKSYIIRKKLHKLILIRNKKKEKKEERIKRRTVSLILTQSMKGRKLLIKILSEKSHYHKSQVLLDHPFVKKTSKQKNFKLKKQKIQLSIRKRNQKLVLLAENKMPF